MSDNELAQAYLSLLKLMNEALEECETGWGFFTWTGRGYEITGHPPDAVVDAVLAAQEVEAVHTQLDAFRAEHGPIMVPPRLQALLDLLRCKCGHPANCHYNEPHPYDAGCHECLECNGYERSPS